MRSPVSLVSTPVRIGRLSSEAAAKTTSPSASRRTRASTLVAGASPMAATTGNSSASMPLMLDRLFPQVSLRVRSFCDSTRSIRWFGRDATRSVRSFAGTVISPSSVTLPGTQQLIPISRLVAVSLSPEFSVLSSTLASTGRVARLLTARLTVPRPRARFSCITEMFMPTSPAVPWMGYPRFAPLLYTVHLEGYSSVAVSRRRVDGVDEAPYRPLGRARAGRVDNLAPSADIRHAPARVRRTTRPSLWMQGTGRRGRMEHLSTSAGRYPPERASYPPIPIFRRPLGRDSVGALSDRRRHSE